MFLYMWVSGCVGFIINLVSERIGLGFGWFVFVGKWMGGCVCDQLVSFSDYSVRECVKGLVGLGGSEFMCVEVCVTGCGCPYKCMYVCVCVCVCLGVG